MTTTMRRLAALLCATVGLLAGIAAGLGVFARGDGASRTVTSALGEVYEIATSGVYANNAQQVVAEGIGWDIFTLAVAAPTLIVASFFVARGSFRGTLVAGGMLGYFLYMYLEYAVTWAFGPLFGLFVAICALSLIGLISVGALVADAGVGGRFDDRFPRRAWAGLSIGMALLLTVLWVARIAEALAADPAVLHGETTMTVQALDLGLVVPVMAVLAVAALRRHPAGLVAAAAFAVTFITMAAAIAAMMISSWIVTGVPAIEPIVVFGIASVLGAIVAARMFASAGPMTDRRAGRAGSVPAIG